MIALPRNVAAQEKRARVGIIRPVHDNGHPEWNNEVDLALHDIEVALEAEGLDPRSEEYALHANLLLRELQAKLRLKALGLSRITHDPSPRNPVAG